MVQNGIVGVGITHLPLQHIWLTVQQTPAQHSPAEHTRPLSQTLDPVLPCGLPSATSVVPVLPPVVPPPAFDPVPPLLLVKPPAPLLDSVADGSVPHATRHSTASIARALIMIPS